MEDTDLDGNCNFSSRVIGGQSIDISQWPTPDEGALPDNQRVQYFNRKQAVRLYLSGARADAIKQAAGLTAKQAYRLIRERCLEIHRDGRPYGWRGLLPYYRIKPYKRQKKIHVDQFGAGAAGAMQTVLDKHPELRRALDARILARPSNTKLVEIKRSRRRHSMWFLDQLRRLGYEMRMEWPFNTTSLGYYSVSRYIDKVLAQNPTVLAEIVGGKDLAKKLKTGDGTNRPVSRFMQRVEMDAHKLDGRFCVSIPLLDGGFQEKIVHRLWVIVILEVVSRVVVGYYFSMRREVSKEDVLRTIKRSLGPWLPREVTFCETPYLPNAGLLSSQGSNFVGLCWDETSVDGALAETCQQVRDALREVVGSTLLDPATSFAKRRSKDDRPFIEAYFRNLAGKGFQRMSNTTGSKPQSRRGTEPEKVALTSRFQYEYAEELLDVLIANYNATPHSGIGHRAPLAYARFLYQHSDSLRHADVAEIEALFSIRKCCVVRGGAHTGRAPFVEFYYARYTNEVLHNRQDLVGKKIWVVWHKEDDGRVAMASTLDGMPLGILRAAPPWHLSPHSLSVRTAISQASSRGKFSVSSGGDAIEEFIHYVESHSQNKLPVHPSYLEARRILVAMAEQSIGTSMLEAAKARAKEEERGPVKNGLTNPLEKGSRSPATIDSTSKPALPPRRMTASRR